MNLRALLSHPFVSDSFWFGASSLATNVLNYAYILMALHYLTKEGFGAFNALVAIITLVTLAMNPLQLQVTRTVAAGAAGALRRHFLDLQRAIAGFAGVALAALALCSVPLAALLAVSAGNLLVLGLTLAVMAAATPAFGIAAGLRKLTFLAWLNLAAALAKLGCAWLLFALGAGVDAGIAGYLAGSALAIAITWRALGAWRAPAPADASAAPRPGSMTTLCLSYLFLALPLTADQVLSQALNPAQAGDYAAVVTLGKLVFFATAPLQVVLYAHLAGARGHARQVQVLMAGLAAVGGAALLVTACLWAGGEALARTLLSPAYAGAAAWVVPYGLAMCVYALAYSVVSFAIARGDARVILPISLASAVQAALFAVRHDSVAQQVANQLAAVSVLGAGALAYLLRCRASAAAPAR